jgi:uncharacterized protein YjeT (DUF2065 family)
MGILNIVLMTLGLIGLAEGMVVVLFPKWTVNIGRLIIKDKAKLRKAGIIELIAAIAIILIAINI